MKLVVTLFIFHLCCSQLVAQDTLTSIYYQIKEDGKLNQIFVHDFYRQGQLINSDETTSRVKFVPRPYDTLTSVSYGSLENTIGKEGFKEDLVRIETQLIVEDNYLRGVGTKIYCLSGQLIYDSHPESEYIELYCNGSIRFKSDSCVCHEENCLPNGYSKRYYNNGILKEEGRLTVIDSYGLPSTASYNIGTWKYYDRTGDLLKIVDWDYSGIVKEVIVKE